MPKHDVALTTKETRKIRMCVRKLQRQSPGGKMIDVHECLEAAKKIVNPPPRYNKNLEVIAKIAKKEAKLFVGNKPRLDKTADKDKQEHAEIVAELKAFLELQKQQISLLFDVVEGGNLRPKQKFQFTSEQLATDDQKLQDAVDFFLATGLIPIRMDKVDVEGFYKYVWTMMSHMPYKKDHQIKLTDKMTNPRKKYFKKIEEVTGYRTGRKIYAENRKIIFRLTWQQGSLNFRRQFQFTGQSLLFNKRFCHARIVNSQCCRRTHRSQKMQIAVIEQPVAAFLVN